MKYISLFIFVLLGLASSGYSQPQIIFKDGFETGVLDTTYWKANPGENGGVVKVVDSFQHVNANFGNSFYGAIIGRETDGDTTTNSLDLTLDLSGQSQVELSFQIKHNGDETQKKDGIYFSDDGGTSFKKVVDFDFSNWVGFAWGKLPPIDIDQLVLDNGLALTDKFVIRFQQYGNKGFSYDYGGNYDGLVIDNVVVQVPKTEFSRLPFTDDFEEPNNPKNSWHVGNANYPANTSIYNTVRPGSVVGIYDNYQNVAGDGHSMFLGMQNDGASTTSVLDLHLNLLGHNQVELILSVKHNGDETHDQDGIYFSDDGGTSFKKVVDFDFSNWVGFAWGKLPPIDIDQLALDNGLALTDKFVIRFQQYGNKGFSYDYGENYDGLVFDDVVVQVPKIKFSQLPFTDDFEDPNNPKESWHVSNANYPANTSRTNTVRPGSIVGIYDNYQGVTGSEYSMFIGRRNDGEHTASSIDLHLDLLNQKQVEFNFRLKDNGDETHEQDGIYFSDDGGASFKKMVDFNFSDWVDFTWGQLPPIDIDQLASENGLKLTNQFIIRFQQYGNKGFSYDYGENYDGLVIDDVVVQAPNVEYAQLPFTDGFENGIFENSWSQGHPEIPLTSLSGSAKPGGVVAVSRNYVPYNGEFSAVLGRLNNGTATTTALDLHLDLTKGENILLEYWIKDLADEQQTRDGLWFSNDSGTTFKKALQFKVDEWTNSQYQFMSLDINRMADSLNLPLTGGFVVRFQQHGSSRLGSDGIVIDNISVTGKTKPTTSVADAQAQTTPTFFALQQNYPNPFNPTTTIQYDLPQRENVKLTIFNTAGQQVKALVNGARKAGSHRITVDMQGQSSGIYFYRLEAGSFSMTRRMLFLK